MAKWDEGVFRSAKHYIATACAGQVESKGQWKERTTGCFTIGERSLDFEPKTLHLQRISELRTTLELAGL